MAENDEHVSEVLNEKARYSCCKKKVNSATTCIKSGKVFHLSCVERDWKEKVKIVDKTRLICLEHPKDVVKDKKDLDGKDIELFYLRTLLKKVKDKDQVLKDHNKLLKEKTEFLEINEGQIPKDNLHKDKNGGKPKHKQKVSEEKLLVHYERC